MSSQRCDPGPGSAEPDPDVAVVLAQLESPDPQVFRDSIRRLVDCGPAVVPALTLALEDPHRGVREGAAHALGDLGLEAAPALDALLARLDREPDDFVLWKVIRALGRLGPTAARALPRLRPIADDPRQTEIIRATAQAAVARLEAR